ncbi:Signal transduction histidine kinase CheA [Cystobacter fuscus DSM 2262]|uniref:Chemotaxis protein CheA n=1 Tax=Cystobacter fuscus (strain ATCC 25194 / DSM 2262 / NBRC 100088 / M29) TaxID=1242864 RepID=S9QSV0_CYSF2|nr:chemotaxis protein CheA [Cystobacter fuscus]EPX59718.1 Signal transduction histidine kinase CheA [Cystobacter fuscus DSM 2262]
MDIDRDELLKVFLLECDEVFALMEEQLVGLEQQPDPERLRTIFRAAHTLKGNATCVELPAFVEFTHELEDLLEHLHTGELAVSHELVSLLLSAVDAMRELRGQLAMGQVELTAQHRALMALMTRWARKELTAPAPATSEKEASPPAPPPPSEPPGRKPLAEEERARNLRVGINKLDQMVDLIGELSIAQGKLTAMLEGDRPREQLIEASRDGERLLRELQELVMNVRMVPLGPTFRQYVRTVRDLAAARGKHVELVFEGEDVEMDTALVENVRDPLLHMIRNAIDHGIETPDIRRARGKPELSQLKLRAAHDAGGILLEVIDDGAGLNKERIIERARALGLSREPEALPEAELFSFIFEPGFSTARELTATSGRGVGMDVVRRNVEALRGKVTVRSREGHGVTLSLRLPLTFAIIDGFLVGVGEETYVVPLEAVHECIELPEGARGRSGERDGVLNLRGEAIPYLRLRHLFSPHTPAPARESMVIVQHPQGKVGLVVDMLHGERQTVIKPLGSLFKDLPCISGASILGNGRIALILDDAALLREATRARRSAAS